MRNYKAFKTELLKNKEFKKAYDELGPEFELVRMIIKKRLKQGLTQKKNWYKTAGYFSLGERRLQSIH